MIEVRHTFALSPETIALLAGLLNPTLPQSIAAQLQRIEDKLSKQDEKIDAFVAQANASFVKLGAAVDNIAADEAAMLKQIQEFQAGASEDLSDANTTKLQAFVDRLQAAAANTQSVADSVPDQVAPPTV